MAKQTVRVKPSSSAFRRELLQWYDHKKRDLPWRGSKDPYEIWVSEAMLQQTTVKTVMPRWRRFLEKYPTIESLANASDDDVLAEWSGLGYYSRARNLKKAAEIVAEQFGGKVPRSFELLLALPGMGRYTASAVASIAFEEPVAVLDANVERVIARLDADERDIKQTTTKKDLWDRAQAVLDSKRPGDWNQAMMELGALICLPKAPQCSICPVSKHCKAFRDGDPERYPVKAPKPEMKSVQEVAVVVRKGEDVLVLRRPPEGSFANMWETPRSTYKVGSSANGAAKRVCKEQANVAVSDIRPLMRIKHVVMRNKIDLHVFEASCKSGSVKLSAHVDFDWIKPEEWMTRPLSTTQKKIAQKLIQTDPTLGDGDFFGQ